MRFQRGLFVLAAGLTLAGTQHVFAGQDHRPQPVYFTANAGQWDSDVLFRAQTRGATLWITKDAIYYQITHRERTPAQAANPETGQAGPEFTLLAFRFEGEVSAFSVTPQGLTEHKSNYYLGGDPTRWRENVPNYTGITYVGLFPGVDLLLDGGTGHLSYKFTGEREEDMECVRLRGETVHASRPEFEAADPALLLGSLEVSYETHAGAKKKSRFVDDGGGIAWLVPSTQAVSLSPAVNDSFLVYSTYLGSSGSEEGFGLDVDASGRAYVTGWTSAMGFPTVSPYDNTFNGGAYDVFVTRVNASGSSLSYSTYLGGSLEDRGRAITVDADNIAYVTGYTLSANFPEVGSLDTSANGAADLFVARLSATGTLQYSTYLGGASSDFGAGIAVDADKNIYVTGHTNSSGYPTMGAYDAILSGASEAIITKLNAAGSAILFSTFLGGSNLDFAYAIALDASRNVFVTGETRSSNFPRLNAYDSTHADPNYPDVFVTKLASAGNSLLYSTLLGGAFDEIARGIAVDNAGSAYVAGYTGSTDFPTKNAYDSSANGDWDVFVTKLGAAGNSLSYSTYVGGTDADYCYGLALDNSKAAHVAGYTISMDFPVAKPYDTTQNGGSDAFLTKLSPSGNSLAYSTYLGGIGDDRGYRVATDDSGAAYVTGYCEISGFPTKSAYDASHNGALDAFVSKLIGTCPITVNGDVNSDGNVNSADIIYLVNFVFKGGAAPQPVPEAGDINCSGGVNSADIIYMVGYVFKGGAAPCDVCSVI